MEITSFKFGARTDCKSLCVLFCLLGLVGCSGNEPTSVKTKFACYSNDRNLRAEFISEVYTNFGPPNFYQKIVVTKMSNNVSETILKMDHGYNVRLDWKDDRLLDITYPEGARIHNYTNIFRSDQSLKMNLRSANSKKGSFTDLKEGCLKIETQSAKSKGSQTDTSH